MSQRAFGFWAVLAVVGASIVFGMIVGARLGTPRVALAAPPGLELAPAAVGGGVVVSSFADIVDAALPAVVGVTSAQIRQERAGDRERPRTPEDLFRYWLQPEQPEQPEQFGRETPRIGEGSGFIISPDGYILTNYHVVEGADSVRVRLNNGKEYKAQLVGSDPPIDLALLKIDDTGLPMLPLGDSARLRVGEWVIAIGNPLEFQQTVTVGVVSGKERRVAIGTTDRGVVSFIQTDAAINFGNSGGPLLDARGNVIGINTAIRRANFAEGIGFALPINTVRTVVEQLRSQGYVRRGFIGITMNDAGMDENAREYYGLSDARGVIVDEVRPADGPAAKAGIKAGDVILKVDGEPIQDNVDLISRISTRQPGDRVRLEVFRKEGPGERGKTLQIEARLTDRQEGLVQTGNAQPRIPGGEEPEAEASTGLGVTVENLDRGIRQTLGLSEDQQGVVVTAVDFESEAAQKGIQHPMVITSVNDRPVRNVGEWSRQFAELEPGHAVKLGVLAAQAGVGERRFFVYLRVPAAKSR